MDENVSQEPKVAQATSRCQRFVACFKRFRMEPVIFLFMFGMSIHLIISENLLIEKACLTLSKYSEQVCRNIQEKKYEDKVNEVQKAVATWKVVIGLVPIIPNILVTISIGPWSDKYGRKPFIILPLFGLILTTTIYLILSYFMYSPVYLMILPNLVVTLLGGYGLFVCVIAYIIEQTTEKERTIRLALFQACVFVGIPVGMAIGGQLFKRYGYMVVYVVSGLVEFVALLTAIFFVPETNPNVQSASFGKKVRDLADFGSFKDGVRQFTMRRRGNTRLKLWLILLAVMCISFTQNASTKIKLLFAEKMLHWDAATYSTFESISLGGGMIGSIIIIGVMSKLLKITDNNIGILGALAGIVGYFLIGNTTTVWMFYLGSIVSMFQVADSIVFRSIMSKTIGKDDIGKVFSFVTVAEQAVPVIGDVVIPLLYSSTLSIFPGLVFLLCSFVLLIPFAILLWFSLEKKLEGNYSRLVQQEEPVGNYGSVNPSNPQDFPTPSPAEA